MKRPSWLDVSRFSTVSALNGKFPFSISLLSWAYNEEDSIEEFLRKAKSLMDSLGVEYEHILIEDNSSDRTYEKALAFQVHYPQLKILRNLKRMDCGWNLRIAVKSSTKEVLFWQTVDWSYDISKISQYLWHLREYDLIQGVRMSEKSSPFLIRHRSDNIWKGFVSLTNYCVIRLLFRVSLNDFQNVTIYPSNLAKSIALESHCSFTNPEMILKAYWKGAQIKQVPIHFIKRSRGKGKGSRPLALFNSVLQIIGCWVNWKILRQINNCREGTIS